MEYFVEVKVMPLTYKSVTRRDWVILIERKDNDKLSINSAELQKDKNTNSQYKQKEGTAKK